MIETLAVANYRSLRELIVPLGRLNLLTGPNAGAVIRGKAEQEGRPHRAALPDNSSFLL